MVVFETVNLETKHLLVDGFRLLKGTSSMDAGGKKAGDPDDPPAAAASEEDAGP